VLWNRLGNLLPVLWAVVSLFTVPCASAADKLSRQVTIYRDIYGTPHIVGETEEATFFGYGYAQAQDHLERMMLQYRDAQGRRAEVLGKDALGDKIVEYREYDYRWGGDYLQRLLHTKKDVVLNKPKIDPQVYTILSAFARGVNAYILENRARVPNWIDSVTPEDIEALERSNYMRFYSIHDALQKMEQKPYKFPQFGSNQWAISPEKSANGRIIHVEHTHMPWANRFQNYEAHLMTPGKLDVGGISWFGSPFFLMGFNDKITWSATWNRPNISDVYIEKINPKNEREYLYEGQWKSIREERETFLVKTQSGMETVTLPLYYTHHGPIVRRDGPNNLAYAVKLPNADGVQYSRNLYLLMKAQNLTDFKAVLEHLWMPRWNLLFSDAHDIFWVHNGVVARRAPGYDWSKPVPGWINETEWGPYLPFAAQPQLHNPPSGFLQNCNNPPWLATKNSGLKPLDPAPYYLQVPPRADAGEEALNTRGERLFQVLSEDRKFTLEDMKSLSLDTYVMASDVIVPLLNHAYAPLFSFSQKKQDRVLDLINAWDRRSSPDSVAYTYIYFWGKAYTDLYSAQSFARFTGYGRHDINTGSWFEQRRARRALEEAISRLQKYFGRSEVRWGDVNVALRDGVFPMDGTGLYDVLHPDEGPVQSNGQIVSNDGWGHLMVVMEGEPKEIWSLLPYGESEDPDSPHYNDQTKLHSERKLKRFWFGPKEILEHTESVWGDKNRMRRLFPAGREAASAVR